MPARKSIKPALLVSIIAPIGSIIAVLGRLSYLHLSDPDNLLFAINFAVAWLPFALSFLLAFVPDMRKAHWVWRLSVVLAGLTYSLLLFKQQYLANGLARRDQVAAVTSAVEESNKHSDKQIGDVRDDLKHQGSRMDERLNALESHLSSGFDELKPPPPKVAALQFSFFVPLEQRFPLFLQSLRADLEGTFAMDFLCKNISEDAAAEQVDIWMNICKDDCRYVSEPAGFEHIEGTPDQERHKFFPYLNHGVSIEWKASIFVPSKFGSFETSLIYACKTCTSGGPKIQALDVAVISPFSTVGPKTKPKARVRRP